MTHKETAKYLKIALASKMYFVHILAREQEVEYDQKQK
jgi:hypothetical protein